MTYFLCRQIICVKKNPPCCAIDNSTDVPWSKLPIKWSIKIMNDRTEIEDRSDSVADAVAAVALIIIFIVTCVFWVSGQ